MVDGRYKALEKEAFTPRTGLLPFRPLEESYSGCLTISPNGTSVTLTSQHQDKDPPYAAVFGASICEQTEVLFLAWKRAPNPKTTVDGIIGVVAATQLDPAKSAVVSLNDSQTAMLGVGCLLGTTPSQDELDRAVGSEEILKVIIDGGQMMIHISKVRIEDGKIAESDFVCKKEIAQLQKPYIACVALNEVGSSFTWYKDGIPKASTPNLKS
eukprot:CAMPEP_0184304514 /NCGR_PEP_ID=MMETSP1049-20130417/14004_1 /TAXON_ID=77928 /ORGANISM="Proteomonas sulcata, Strain CCMP704" /LENGTH=211 /DNA_ID=CAMNT_0026616331 /DNA_START=130 /DNA_END=765 /DNA_ORIENTATION=+